MSSVRQGLAAFGTFWWDFLVGDTPELFFATLGVIGLALALRHHTALGFVLVPCFTAFALLLSVLRGKKPDTE